MMKHWTLKNFKLLTQSKPEGISIRAVMLLVSVFLMFAACLLELRDPSTNSNPLIFVSTIIGLKLGLFQFAPFLKKNKATSLVNFWQDSFLQIKNDFQAKGESKGSPQQRRSKKNIQLWDTDDPRLDVSLFRGTVPTIIVNHEQRIMDWNIAFETIFGCHNQIKQGRDINCWYKYLENFKRVNKRSQKLYGESILPLADRERVTYISPTFGRMVFTKILNPIIEQSSGKTIGWTIVLNINSVNKRAEFFDTLFGRLNHDSKEVRYFACFNGVFKNSLNYQLLVREQLKAISPTSRVLQISPKSGALTRVLLKNNHKVTVVENNLNSLRAVRNNTSDFEGRIKYVKQNAETLHDYPENHYDYAIIEMSIMAFEKPEEVLFNVAKMLRPGGKLIISAPRSIDHLKNFLNLLRTDLENSHLYENLKIQFQHIVEYESAIGSSGKIKNAEELCELIAIKAGLFLTEQNDRLFAGNVTVLSFQKP